MRKGPDPDLYLWLMDPDPGGPKNADPVDPDPFPDPDTQHWGIGEICRFPSEASSWIPLMSEIVCDNCGPLQWDGDWGRCAVWWNFSSAE